MVLVSGFYWQWWW